MSLGDIKENIPKFSYFYAASFIVYIFTLFFILKGDVSSDDSKQHIAAQNIEIDQKCKTNPTKILWTILIFSFIFRLTLLPATPSDDIYRYLWEGKLQLNLVNPYLYAPESPELEHFRDKFFPGINHKHLATIYPPLTLIGFAIADLISHSVISMKSFFLFFDLILTFLLVRLLKILGKDPANVLIYAWSPLVLISFAARGHCDSMQIFFVVLALYLFYRQKKLTSILSVSLAVVSKFISVIVVPFLILGNKPKYFFVLFLAIILLYTPYLRAGTGLFSTLFHFGTQYHYNDSLHFVILCLSLGSPFITKIITSATFGILLTILYIKYSGKDYLFISRLNFNVNRSFDENESALRYTFFAIGLFLMLSPTVHPWYLTWIVPFLCFYQNKAWLILTGTVVFYYFMNHSLFSTIIEYNNEWVWKEVHWLKLPEYIPFYSLLVYDFLKTRILLPKKFN